MILGTVQLGLSYGINNSIGQPDKHDSFNILDAAHAGGITIIDTAAAYGSSEAIIADYLQAHPQAFSVCTKLAPRLEECDETVSEDVIRAEIQKRCDTLRQPSLYCCYLHRFEQCKNVSVIASLVKEKKEGRICNIGVSIYYPHELTYIVEHLADVIDIVQLPINAFSIAYWKDVLEESHASGLRLIARSVYLQGLVFMNPNSEFVLDLGASLPIHFLRKRAETHDLSIAEYCFGCISLLSEIDDIIVGCESVEQVEENLRVQEKGKVLPSTELDILVDEFADISEAVINPLLWPNH